MRASTATLVRADLPARPPFDASAWIGRVRSTGLHVLKTWDRLRGHDAPIAWAEHRSAAFDHAMTEPFSAFVLASIERALSGALADLKRAETLGHGEDADFAHETVAMLTANREALRTARAIRGWSEDGDEAPEA